MVSSTSDLESDLRRLLRERGRYKEAVEAGMASLDEAIRQLERDRHPALARTMRRNRQSILQDLRGD